MKVFLFIQKGINQYKIIETINIKTKHILMRKLNLHFESNTIRNNVIFFMYLRV